MAYGTLSGILHFWVLVLQWFGECCTRSAWRPQFHAHETFIMMRPEGLVPEGVRGTTHAGAGAAEALMAREASVVSVGRPGVSE